MSFPGGTGYCTIHGYYSTTTGACPGCANALGQAQPTPMDQSHWLWKDGYAIGHTDGFEAGRRMERALQQEKQ